MSPSRASLLGLLLAYVSILAGCAGTQSYLRALEHDGTIRVDLADDKSYDYKVLIENRVDFGWDGGNDEDRLEAVQLMFGERCGDVKVIAETPKIGRASCRERVGHYV